jgi:HK97 family phage major capsid protein
MRRLISAVVSLSPIVRLSTRWISDGNPGTFVTLNDLSNTSTTWTESAQATENDPAFTRVSFPQCPTYTADALFRASRELLQDSSIDLVQIIVDLFGQRIARGLDHDMLVGANGLVANAAVTVTSGSPTTISYADIQNLVFSLDAAYRGSPNAAFVCNDATLKVLSGILDSSNRPILTWLSGDTDFANVDTNNGSIRVPTIFGIPAFSAPSMDTVASTSKTLLLADFARAGVVRLATDTNVTALKERYADIGQIGYVGVRSL